MFGTWKTTILDSAPMTFRDRPDVPGVLQIGGGTPKKITFDPIDGHFPDKVLFETDCDEVIVREHFAQILAIGIDERRTQPPPKHTPPSNPARLHKVSIPLLGIVLDLSWSSMSFRRPNWYTTAVWNLERQEPVVLHGVAGTLKWSSGAWHKLIFEPVDSYWMSYRLRDGGMTRDEAESEFARFLEMLTP